MSTSEEVRVGAKVVYYAGGEGVITEVREDGCVKVKWDHTGYDGGWYPIGKWHSSVRVKGCVA